MRTLQGVLPDLLDVVAALGKVVGGIFRVLHGQHVGPIRLQHAPTALPKVTPALPAQNQKSLHTSDPMDTTIRTHNLTRDACNELPGKQPRQRPPAQKGHEHKTDDVFLYEGIRDPCTCDSFT